MVVLGGSIAETRPHPDQPAAHVVDSAYRGGSRVPGVRLWVLRVAWVLDCSWVAVFVGFVLLVVFVCVGPWDTGRRG